MFTPILNSTRLAQNSIFTRDRPGHGSLNEKIAKNERVLSTRVFHNDVIVYVRRHRRSHGQWRQRHNSNAGLVEEC